MPQRINKNQIAAQEAWQVPQYSPAWVDFDNGSSAGSFGGVRYMKDTLGFVHMRGWAKNTSGGTQSDSNIFLLPVGYRPIVRQRFANVQGGGQTFASVDVWADGQVKVNTSVANNEYLSLSNIVFLAEG